MTSDDSFIIHRDNEMLIESSFRVEIAGKYRLHIHCFNMVWGTIVKQGVGDTEIFINESKQSI